MKNRKAFSLVELLVVTAIISILLGTTTVALRHGLSSARSLDCQMRLRTTARALGDYAADQAEWLPPGPIEIGGNRWIGDPDMGSPLEVFDAWRPRWGLASEEGWYGQGLLFRQRYLQDPRSYYCPQRERDGRGYAQLWPEELQSPSSAGATKTKIFVTLVYRGGMSSRSGQPEGPLRLGDAPSDAPVVADNPAYGVMYHEGRYNIGHIDGHVDSHSADEPLIPDGRIDKLWPALD
jgi:prepilin-type N-terminal cleavage/methylation domain-containing protein/prepilin-type processing-associated H-X9-DG protein